MTIDDLRTRWATRRDEFVRLGAMLDAAKTIDEFLTDLDAIDESQRSELLSLEQSAALSGYSAEHLARLVRSGRIPNAGRAHKPLIRRADLPKKSANSIARSTKPAYDPAADARALLSRRGEG